MIDFPYEIDDGIRYRSEPIAFGSGLTSQIIRTKRAIRLRSNDEAIELGAMSTAEVGREPIPSALDTGIEAPGSHGGRRLRVVAGCARSRPATASSG